MCLEIRSIRDSTRHVGMRGAQCGACADACTKEAKTRHSVLPTHTHLASDTHTHRHVAGSNSILAPDKGKWKVEDMFVATA